MTWVTRAVTSAGLVILAHSGYSAYEHSAITPTLTASALGTRQTTVALPIDIRLQTIFATLLICFGLVIASENLRPIRWHVWAGNFGRQGRAALSNESRRLDPNFLECPFTMLESRPAFLNIRRERREFARWAEDEM
ncbi:hypothetical protein E4U52_004347 [Claviceps spartinae]|nr:hypothetical protein E4U52_004347 [Claviceps spartinae]KAG6082021.1 hypothetical protein E4U15_002663 [Claviceps sp. LM218 group G6]KAG6096675.1 hypothetical protein E4U30_001359 [Claviceps sp. LM220 group G6]